MIVNREQGVVTQQLRVLFEQLLYFVELHVRIDQELLLLVLVHIVLVEKRSMVPPNQLLVDLPADLAHQLRYLLGHLLVIINCDRVDTSQRVLALHIDPNFFKSLLFLQICFPEFVLLLEKLQILVG